MPENEPLEVSLNDHLAASAAAAAAAELVDRIQQDRDPLVEP